MLECANFLQRRPKTEGQNNKRWDSVALCKSRSVQCELAKKRARVHFPAEPSLFEPGVILRSEVGYNLREHRLSLKCSKLLAHLFSSLTRDGIPSFRRMMRMQPASLLTLWTAPTARVTTWEATRGGVSRDGELGEIDENSRRRRWKRAVSAISPSSRNHGGAGERNRGRTAANSAPA